jgi:hypothetical protein
MMRRKSTCYKNKIKATTFSFFSDAKSFNLSTPKPDDKGASPVFAAADRIGHD